MDSIVLHLEEFTSEQLLAYCCQSNTVFTFNEIYNNLIMKNYHDDCFLSSSIVFKTKIKYVP